MGKGDWETEEDSPEEAASLDFKPKAHLILEGSDQFEWGVVKDCKGCINFVPEDAVAVGTWNKYRDGVFWVSLTTPIEALRDRATQLFAELARNREKQIAAGVFAKGAPKARKPRKEKVPEEPEGPSPTVTRLQELRVKLKGSK